MRILLAASEFPPGSRGGVSTFSYSVAYNLIRSGHEVSVLTTASKKKHPILEQKGVQITGIAINWLENVRVFRLLRLRLILNVAVFLFVGIYLVKRRKIDLVYCTNAPDGIGVRLASTLCQTPYLLMIHGTEVVNPRGRRKRFVQFVIGGASGFTVLADRQRKSLIEMAIPDNKIFKLPLEIDLERFQYSDGCDEVIRRHGLRGKRVLLTIGKLVKRKGHDMVITALPGILERVPDVVYLVAGYGPEEPVLKELVNRAGVHDNVIFCGYLPDAELANYYHACDLFVMPSREVGEDIEGFGIVYLEANACAKPVIGGRSGGVSDAVEDGVSGLLVNPESVDEIAQAVITLLTNSELAERLGRQGRKRVEERFTYKAVAEKLNRALEEIRSGWLKKSQT